MGYLSVRPLDVIVRKKSLIKKSINIYKILEKPGSVDRSGENEDFVSIGPMFGDEVLMATIRELEKHGLVYVDDFYALEVDVPDWLSLGVCLVDS